MRSLDTQVVTAEQQRITWRFPPTTLVAGRGYWVGLSHESDCRELSRRTWAHDGQQVNSGQSRCIINSYVMQSYRAYRMWHQQGEQDSSPSCVHGALNGNDRIFDPSMPSGWLTTISYNGDTRFVARRYTGLSPAPCADPGHLSSAGLEEVYWRPDPDRSASDEVICRWTPFAPPGQDVPNGWYYALYWTTARQGAPRDMYLKLEYNPDDDIRTMPSCAGLLYAACEQRVRDAGFTNVTRITLNGSDVDFSLPPDGVKRTDPGAGTQLPISRVIVLYANPGDPLYTATRFKPILRWDTSEDYRPLNVNRFFQETTAGPTGDPIPRHRLCRRGTPRPTCGSLFVTADDLSRYTAPTDFIHVQGGEDPERLGADDDDYQTNRACRAEGIYECDKGESAATYFHKAQHPSGGYDVYDYWWFYRFNRVPDAANEFSKLQGTGPLLHEGDWEGISVGVRPGAPIFDFVSFSQHGRWWSYLRHLMECDDGAALSCEDLASGSPKGRRVVAYVADGTHAQYPYRCPRNFGIDCAQTDGQRETGYDGAARWDGGDDPSTNMVDLEDPSIAYWGRWAGRWGLLGEYNGDFGDGPSSPGAGSNGAHYDAPWQRECAPNSPGCQLEAPQQSPASRSSTTSCEGWFGGHVAVLGCSPSGLQRALRRGRLGDPGTMRISVGRAGGLGRITARTATAPGLAQTLGRPLETGDTVTVEGTWPSDGRLLVRLAGVSDGVEVTPTGGRWPRGPLVLTVVARAGGSTLKEGRGDSIDLSRRTADQASVFTRIGPPGLLAPGR